jgi:hypothetical protein
MVVVIASATDEHALRVKHILEERHAEDGYIFDTSCFPVSAGVEGRFGSDSPTFRLTSELQAAVDLQSAKSFWWRRPQGLSLDPRITDLGARNFAYGECLSALHGMLACCDGLWVNDIHADDAADYKPLQLKTAAHVGFMVPDTLITNDPRSARDFWDEHDGAVVYKAFNQHAVVWRPARRLQPEELSLLSLVKAAPVIFQALVPGTHDIRVTIVGDEVFAAEFVIPTDGPIDYRLHLAHAPCRPHLLPADVTKHVNALMSDLKLEYGAIDLRLTPDGRYVFFELNTGGEFLFVQHRTGQPIAEAVAAHLARGRSTHSRTLNC